MKTHRSLLVLMVTVFAISFLGTVTYFSWDNYFNKIGKKPEQSIPRDAAAQMTGKSGISGNTAVRITDTFLTCQKYFGRECDRVRELPITEKQDLIGLTVSDLRLRYPSTNGWQVKDNLPVEVTLIREHPGLCPDHILFRHLELDASGNYLAVYTGPAKVGKEGGLIRITDIKLKDLPAEIQQKITSNSMEFTNEDELQQGLDSFDEYLNE